jgi:hypothetical protein
MERSRVRLTAADVRNLVILLLAVLLLWIPRFEGPIDLRWDAGVYYVLGTSLAEGRGYRLLNEPGEIEAVQYPPLLPALVAVVQRAVGTSDSVVAGHALRFVFFLLTVAYTAATYALARQLLPPGLSMLAGLLTSFHQTTPFLSDLCYAEIPYALVSVLFALGLRAGRGFAAGALAVAAFLLRSAGIALLAAWVGEALLRRHFRKAAARAAVALLPLLLWQAYVLRVTHEPEYRQPRYAYQRAPSLQYNVTYAENLRLVDPFRPEEGWLTAAGLARRVAGNVLRLPAGLGDAVSVGKENWYYYSWLLGLEDLRLAVLPTMLLRATLGSGVLLGLFWLWRRGEQAMVLYVLGTLALVALTPWPREFPRYLAPLAPFLALAFAGAAGWAWSGGGRPARAAVGLLLPIVVLAQAVGLFVLYSYEQQAADHRDRSGTRATGRLFYHGPEFRALDEALDWVAEHARRDAVLAATLPHSAFLRTGHQAVLPPREVDPAVAQRLLDSVPVDYLVMDNRNNPDVALRYDEPVVKAYPGLWELVYDRGTRVYRRRARDSPETNVAEQ